MKKLLLIALLASAGIAQAEERGWTTYKKFVESMRLDRFYALPAAERDKLDFCLTVEPSNKKFKVADMKPYDKLMGSVAQGNAAMSEEIKKLPWAAFFEFKRRA